MEILYSLLIYFFNNFFIDKKIEINVKVDRVGKIFNISYFFVFIMMVFYFFFVLTFCLLVRVISEFVYGL